MHCYLLELPVELTLMISEELCRDLDIEAHVNEKDNDQEEMQDEPIRISRDLISWSSTCSYFRNLLAPDVYKTVRLVNDEENGMSVIALANSQHNIHVKELHFIGSALGDVHCKKPAFSDIEAILPRSVKEILCNLQRFPNLEKLSIKFDVDFEHRNQWTEYESVSWRLSDIWKAEDPEQVLEAEASEAWRALMSRTYSALTQNQSPQFKHLEIKQLNWKSVSNFHDPAFHNFLGHLEQFTLSIDCGCTSDRRNFDRLEFYPSMYEYLDFIKNLDKYFFNHLANITTLSIKLEYPRDDREFTSNDWFTYSSYFLKVFLKADQMPLLTTLRLVCFEVREEIAAFLVGHSNTLEAVTLRDCYPTATSSDGESISWSEFINTLFCAQPTRLRRFELGYSDSYKMTFSYGHVDDWMYYDFLRSEEEEALGADQESWDQLMELVERNVKEAAKLQV